MKTVKVKKNGVEIPIPFNLKSQYLANGWKLKQEVSPSERRKRYEQELAKEKEME